MKKPEEKPKSNRKKDPGKGGAAKVKSVRRSSKKKVPDVDVNPLTKKPYKFSKATRSAMAKSHTGKHLSEETKQKIRDARKERKVMIEMGLLEPYRHPEEVKAKLRKLARARKRKPSKQARENSLKTRKGNADVKKVRRLSGQILSGKI